MLQLVSRVSRQSSCRSPSQLAAAAPSSSSCAGSEAERRLLLSWLDRSVLLLVWSVSLGYSLLSPNISR